jgi:hypothetical protein
MRVGGGAFFEVTMARAVTRKSKPVNDLKSTIMLKSLSSEKRHAVEKRGSELPDAFQRRQVVDPLTKHLGCTYFYQSMRFKWMVHEILGLKYPMEVSRYYPELKVAIDIGQVLVDEIAIKQELCEQNGVRYINIESAGDMKNLAMGLS